MNAATIAQNLIDLVSDPTVDIEDPRSFVRALPVDDGYGTVALTTVQLRSVYRALRSLVVKQPCPRIIQDTTCALWDIDEADGVQFCDLDRNFRSVSHVLALVTAYARQRDREYSAAA